MEEKMEYCDICGTKLQETNYGRKHCPNHGIVEMSTESSSDTPGYV